MISIETRGEVRNLVKKASREYERDCDYDKYSDIDRRRRRNNSDRGDRNRNRRDRGRHDNSSGRRRDRKSRRSH